MVLVPPESLNPATQCALPFGNIVGPLVLWSVKKEESEFVDHHGKEAVNFQLNMLVYGFIAALLSFFVIGMFILPVLYLVSVILPILAGVDASKGNYHRYPFVLIKFVR